MRVSRSKAKVISELTVDQDVPMAAHKLTGLAAGAGAGQSVRYEQVIGVFLPLAGGALTGDLSIGAHNLKTTNMIFKEAAATHLAIRNAADDAHQSLDVNGVFFYYGLMAKANALPLAAPSVNGEYLTLEAMDTDGAPEEVARLQGAADPYFQMTLPPVITATARPGTPVAGHIVINSTSGAFEIYDGTHFKQEVHSIHKSFTYTDDGVNLIAAVPAGTLILGIFVNVTEAFTSDAGVTSIGTGGDPDGFLAGGNVNADTEGWKPADEDSLGDLFASGGARRQFYPVTSAENINITIASAGQSAGIIQVYLVYITLN